MERSGRAALPVGGQRARGCVWLTAWPGETRGKEGGAPHASGGLHGEWEQSLMAAG